MKVIIIDDEQSARDVLENLLKELCPEVEEIIKEENLIDGVAAIRKEHPDIVFLDIEMPGHTGLEILDFFKNEKIDFQIIFVTAYNNFAIEAFKLSAVDYLLKPIDDDDLVSAFAKAVQLQSQNNIKTQLQDLEKAFTNLAINKIALDIPKGKQFVSNEDIIMFKADGVYTQVHLKNGKMHLITKTLKHFVDQLENNIYFYRPHRSYLINLKFMDRYIKDGGYFIELQNKTLVPIARQNRDSFFEVVERVFN